MDWRTVPGVLLACGVLLATPSFGQSAAPPVPRPAPVVLLPDKPELEPKALDILKATSAKLAAARTMSFTAIATYESPARTLQPLSYTVGYDVTLQRPDKLRVISPGDGPPSEFYYDGKTITAYEPQADLVAMADAPPTIDEMLKVLYQRAAVSFPFDDVIASDPYQVFAPELRLAFYIGQSRLVGGTLTDMVGVANNVAQAQIWIGVEDKLPRLYRLTYFNEPGKFRHSVEFSNWRLDPVLAAGTFSADRAQKARRIRFAAPDDPAKK